MANGTVISLDVATAEALKYRRRLTDKILIAFHHACEEREFVTADQLLRTLEALLDRRTAHPSQDRRKVIESLVGAHFRLLELKQEAQASAFQEWNAHAIVDEFAEA